MGIKEQREEFDAADRFAKELRRVSMTAVVDDDYPEVRHDYESALANLFLAMKKNDRFIEGNRYQLKEAK
jgi:hypothetical protein